MDYDDNDFQNQNLHLAGEANNKSPPILQPYPLPKFDFDDTLNTHLRFDSLVETEGFLGIEGNEDSNWIEDFSRESSGIVFSSVATESCAISRHTNVWSEATSSESVEMLLNSVGQDDEIVRDNTTKKSDTSDELGCKMEQIEPGQTNLENSLSKDETANLQSNPSVDDSPGDSSALKTDAGQEHVLVKDDSPTVAEESSMEEKNAILASNTVSIEAVDTAGHDKLGTEMTNNSLLDQMEDEANAESKIENDCSDGTVQAVVTCSGELNNQKTLLQETSNDENDISDHIQSSHNCGDLTIDAQPVLVEALYDSRIYSDSEVENVEAKNFGETAKPDLKEIELFDVTVLERGDQALSTLEVGGQDDSGTQCQDLLISCTNTSAIVEASLDLAGELTTPTISGSMEKHELLSHNMEIIANERESTFQIETHIHLVETSESVCVSHMDSMDESTKGGVSKKNDNNEGSAHISVPKQSMEFDVNANDSDQDAKSPQILSERVVSDSVGDVSSGLSSKLAESKSQSDTIPTDKSESIIDGKEVEAFPLNTEELQLPIQDGASAVSLTSSIDLHIEKISSDVNEQGSFSVNEKLSSGEPDNSQTVPPVDASTSVSQMNQQARKHTEDTQQSTQFVGDSASEGSKDAIDTDAAGQDLLQQPDEIILEENLVPEVVNTPETLSVMEKDEVNGKPNTSSFANLGSEAGNDSREEDNTAASGGFITAETSVSHPKDIAGDAVGIGDNCASTCSEPSVKFHVTGTENTATNLGTPLISFPTVKTSEVQHNMTEADSVKNPEDQKISNFMPAGSPVLNKIETFSSGMNVTSDPQKVEEISKAVHFSQATLVSPIVMGSPSTSNFEKTAAKSSKTKSERKPRRTSKSAGKETFIKGATSFQHFQSGGKTNAINQITQSTEKQQRLQSPALKAFGTLLTPTASLPDLNSSALSNILHRPFTDLQQVQLRAQIFVYGALIQGTAPDEAYMISAFGGLDGGKGSWDKEWRACVLRAQKFYATLETPLQSRAGKTETLLSGHTSNKESPATNPMIPLSSPLWNLSTPLDTLHSSSIQRGSAAAHQPLISSSHVHQTPPVKNIVGHNTPWMSPLPYHNPWLGSPQTSGFDIGSRIPVFPINDPVKLTPIKESSLPYSSVKPVQSGTSSGVSRGTPTLEPASTVVVPAQHSTQAKSRKRKKMPVSVESGPSILNSLKQTELDVSPLVSISTSVPIATAPANLAFSAGTLPNVVSITSVPMNLASTFPGKKIKSSLPSPIFGGNLVPEVKQRSVLSEDTFDKLKEAKMHAENASAFATAAVSHSEYVWKQIEQQRHAGLQPETQGILASAAVAVAAAAAVAKAAASAANVAANAAVQAKLMAEEAALPSAFEQGSELANSNDNIIPCQGTPASTLKGEGTVVSSSSVLIAAREAAKKMVEASTAATKQAENMASIVKAAELASEAVSQAGVLVSMGHPPLLNKLIEAGPSNYWRQGQESQEVQPCKTGVLEKKTVATTDGTFASPRTMETELDDSVRMADGASGQVSAIGKTTKGQKGHKGADLANNNVLVFESEGSKSLIDTQTESEQITKTPIDEDIKEGSNVEVYKEGSGIRTAWYSANVLSLEDDKAYVLFNDLSVEQGTDKLEEWVALKGEGDDAPKIRTARSVTAMPYEGTRKRRRAAIRDPVWKIGDKVDTWVHESWLEGVIKEKNKKDENTVTVHFPAQGDTLTIKAWNLRPSLVWKDGKWIECSSSGENVSSAHEGDTPKEKRPRLGTPALVAEGKDTSMKIVDDLDLGKPPQTGVFDLGVSENTFNIGRSTSTEEKPNPLRMKRTGLQKPGSKVIFGVPKPGKKRKFMDVSKHYVSEASSKTRERKEPPKPVKSIVPQSSGSGSWRMPSKTISREKQTTIPKPKTFKPALNTKEKPGATSRTIPRKNSRNTTASNMESDATADQSGENKDPACETTTNVLSKGTVEEQTTSSSKNSSSSTTNKGKVTPTTGRLTKIEEGKVLAENTSKTSDGMEPRRSIRRIQPTSRLLEGLQTSMMTSKLPSVSHNKSQSRK